MADDMPEEVDKDGRHSDVEPNYAESYTIESLIGKSLKQLIEMPAPELEKYFAPCLVKQAASFESGGIKHVKQAAEGKLNFSEAPQFGGSKAFSLSGSKPTPIKKKLSVAERAALMMKEAEEEMKGIKL